MITVLDVLRDGLRSMHGMLDKAVGDMTADNLNFRPAQGGVTPFFSLWHYVRTEDNIVNFVVQGAPTVWLDGGYDVKFGLHRTAQGTGMTDAQAQQVRIEDVGLWREYQAKVWQATDQFLNVLQPEDVDGKRVTIKPMGEMSLWAGLNGMCLSHGYRHVGEIEYARGVIGLGGLTI
ncbi:MAG TPA: DinB family protein [Dehalococcoidia bacterium]|jgi:hypothetical protein